MKNSKTLKGYFYIFLAGAIWGTTGTCMKFLALQGCTDFQIAFHMQFFGVLLMFPITVAKCGFKSLKIDLKLMAMLALTGLVSETFYDLTFAAAVNRVGVAFAGVLLYLSPVFVMILSRLLFKESITKQKFCALIMNLAGCFITVTGCDISGFNVSLVGILFGILAALCYGMITIFDKYTAEHGHPFVLTFYILLFGFIFIALISRCWTFPAYVFAPKTLAYGLMAGLLAAQLPYLFFMSGIACGVEASKAPIVASVEVVVSAILGLLIFKENLGLINIAGIAIVLLSIAVLNLNFRGKNKELQNR